MKNTTDLRKFLISIIVHRKKLIGLEVSQKNQMLMHSLVEQLYDKWLVVFPNATPEQLANFFIQNQEKFKELLPGEKSKHHVKFLYEFNTHLEFALNLMTDLPAYFKFKEIYKKFQQITKETFGENAAAQVLIHNVPEEYFITKCTIKNSYAHNAVDLGNQNQLTFLRPKN